MPSTPDAPQILVARTIDTALCPMRAATTARGICLLEMGSPERQQRAQHELEQAFGIPMQEGTHPLLDQLEAELGAYFAGALPVFSVPLDMPGTDWQRRVWSA